MDDVYEIGLLMDFYGQLLTKNQLSVMEMYYNDNWSLAEIAESLNISRQGVHDFIKRSRAILLEYEDKLKLIKRFGNTKERINTLLEYMALFNYEDMSEGNTDICHKIEDGLMDLIKDA